MLPDPGVAPGLKGPPLMIDPSLICAEPPPILGVLELMVTLPALVPPVVSIVLTVIPEEVPLATISTLPLELRPLPLASMPDVESKVTFPALPVLPAKAMRVMLPAVAALDLRDELPVTLMSPPLVDPPVMVSVVVLLIFTCVFTGGGLVTFAPTSKSIAPPPVSSVAPFMKMFPLATTARSAPAVEKLDMVTSPPVLKNVGSPVNWIVPSFKLSVLALTCVS